jgi:hypothetical protein
MHKHFSRFEKFFVPYHPIPNLESKIESRDKMVLYICQKRIIHSLRAIMHFLQLQCYYDICAGSYTFAVEEWKALFLKGASYSKG